MAIVLSQPIELSRTLPVDLRYGPYVLAEYAGGLTDILALIPVTRRYLGLTIGVIEPRELDPIGDPGTMTDVIVEYWLRLETTNFVEKNNDAGSAGEVSIALSLTSPLPIRTSTITDEVVLDTNRPIGRDIGGLLGETVNVNRVDPAINNYGTLKDFIEAVFFPWVDPTISCGLTNGGGVRIDGTIQEVGDEIDITIIGTVTPNSGEIADLSNREVYINIGGGYVLLATGLAGHPFEYEDEDRTLAVPGTINYKVTCDMLDENDEILGIEAVNFLKFNYPVIIGYSDLADVGVDGPDSAEVLAAIAAGRAIEKLIDLTTVNSLTFTQDVWRATQVDKVRWIAVPSSSNKIPSAYNNGQLDFGDMPSADEFGVWQALPTIVAISKPLWGAAVDYGMFFTSQDGVNPVETGFGYVTMTITLSAV